MSAGRTVSVTTPKIGPESRLGSIWNVVAPVTSSPAASAACTGAAPRHAGSNEKCKLIQPSGGTASRPVAQQGAVRHHRAAVRRERGELGDEIVTVWPLGSKYRQAVFECERGDR